LSATVYGLKKHGMQAVVILLDVEQNVMRLCKHELGNYSIKKTLFTLHGYRKHGSFRTSVPTNGPEPFTGGWNR
jgi:hypothetical protein